MALIKPVEYLLSVDNFNKPQIATEQEAIAILLLRIILLEPGSDPLHPEMGVGIKNYRYSLNKKDEIENKIQEQVNQYLPEFSTSNVNIVEITDKKVCNIEITIENTTYVYDSTIMPTPLTIEDLSSSII